ncbi:MAG: Type-1 restriction enzyme specificity protein [candidate division WS6 bacterium OLB20]|uniref:Type-1 restriction enzyme specificity protein n=1 Tax=candidate division WS6 bacterium OLB20 TaxID=1617426 RepID=A0A136M131_9BACT|nr:MAG: Type-1 restriction enzyme specificity protein [candidate division WS6 bacterium OLB20]
MNHQSKLEQLIAEKCPEGVEFVFIEEVAECLAGATPRSKVTEFWENGTIPWMSSGEVNKKTIFETDKKITQVGYDSCSTKLVPPYTVVIALAGQGKTRGLVARTRIELCTNQSLCSIIPNERLDSDFLYHFLSTQYQQLRTISSGDGTRGGLNLEMIRSFKIPLPPLAVQQEIVSILDKFTQLEAELEAELEARRKQYEYFLEDLYVLEKSPCKPLDEVGMFTRGKRFVKDDIVDTGQPCIHYGEMYTHYGAWATDAISFLPETLANRLRVAKHGDVVIVAAGETIEDIGGGVAWLGEQDIVVHDACFIFTHKLNPKYVSYFLQTKKVSHADKETYTNGKDLINTFKMDWKSQNSHSNKRRTRKNS